MDGTNSFGPGASPKCMCAYAFVFVCVCVLVCVCVYVCVGGCVGGTRGEGVCVCVSERDNAYKYTCTLRCIT